jgi:uncharacterized protein UPF0167
VAPLRLADVGTSFALFEGPVAQVADVLGPASCSLCGCEGFCLALSIGHDVIAPCSSCGAPTDFSATGDPGLCVSCGARSALRARVEGAPACLICLRDGKFAITKDSDLGMVRWRDAVAESTHGLPLPRGADGSPLESYQGFEAAPPHEGGWQRIRVAGGALLALVLTPDYDSIQGAIWKFHCGNPMAFVGRWGRSDFAAHAPDGDGAAFARAVAELDDEAFDGLGHSGADDDAVVWAYAFRCGTCGALAANWDVD